MSGLSDFQIGKQVICSLLAFLLATGPSLSHAQSAFVAALPEPGTILDTSPSFVPILVKGMVIHPDQPLHFDLIVDSGNDLIDPQLIQQESERMTKYFLAAVTVPEKQLWVNLSPYEQDRMIANELGQTVLVRDMLAQDYILKQLTASLIYPEKGLGKEFWDNIYKRALEKFGTSAIPVDTFNKVWIAPKQAEVYEKGNAVYITGATLTVMLDSDHRAMTENNTAATAEDNLSQAILREIIIPAIEQEVNEGKNFSHMRQIYHAAILAKWYREKIQNTLLADVYMDKNRVSGVTTDEKTLKEEIYNRYIAAYKKGTFNYIKEEADPQTGDLLPRQYFSGGETLAIDHLDRASNPDKAQTPTGELFRVEMLGQPDSAQTSGLSDSLWAIAARLGLTLAPVSTALASTTAVDVDQSPILSDPVNLAVFSTISLLSLAFLLYDRRKSSSRKHQDATPARSSRSAKETAAVLIEDVFSYVRNSPGRIAQRLREKGQARLIEVYSSRQDWKSLSAMGTPGILVLAKNNRTEELSGISIPELEAAAAEARNKRTLEIFNTINGVINKLDSSRGLEYYEIRPGPMANDPVTGTKYPTAPSVTLRTRTAGPETAPETPDAAAVNGGIDIQSIAVTRQAGEKASRFNDEAIRGIITDTFNGITPVFIRISPLDNVLTILR